MEKTTALNAVYAISDQIIVRDIEKELIIIPLTSGRADLESEFYALKDTARAFWLKVDGQQKLGHIVEALANEFDASRSVVETEILLLVEELLKRQMLIDVTAL